MRRAHRQEITMAKHTFEVEQYQVTLGDHPTTHGGLTLRSRGTVACHGQHLHLIFHFLEDVSEAPAARWMEDARTGLTFLPYDMMDEFVDLLRWERPIRGCIDTDSPADSYLITEQEPVGEEESRRWGR
jgi:hypothetical protein